MTIKNKLLIIGLMLCLYPVCRWLDQDNMTQAPPVVKYTYTINSRDSLFRAISACIFFVGDTAAWFSKDGYITYLMDNKYRTHLLRDSLIFDRYRIMIVPEYLETFNVGQDTIIKKSYGQYDILPVVVSSRCLNTTPHDLYLMLLEYKRALCK